VSATVLSEALYEQLDARTLDILDRRRTAKTIKRRGWLVRRALVAADVVGLASAFVVAELVYPQMHRAGSLGRASEFAFFTVSLPGWVVAAKIYGLYGKDDERTDHSTADDFSGVFHLVTVCTWLLYAGSLLTALFNPQFGKLFVFWALAIAGVTSARGIARVYCRRQIHYLQNTVIVGAGDVGQTIARKLLNHPEYGINLVGFIDDQPKERLPGLEHLTLLGSHSSISELVELLDVERVIIAFSNETHETSLNLIRTLNGLDVQVDIVPRFFEVLSPGADVHGIEGVPMWGVPPTKLSRSSKVVKRTFDLCSAVLGLALLAPVFVLIAVLIRTDSSGPVFFRQIRMGANGAAFRIWKFRTMAVGADERKHEVAHLNKHLAPGQDARMFKINGDPRVTRIGASLRRWSLDELPQLFNVISGEMSLVGPRPLILDEHSHVNGWGWRRLDLKPGITGVWQVLGRDGIGFEEMVRFDYLYVTTWSPFADLRLIARTLPVLIRGRGADAMRA
jgi:exopolysaccharide biosynthesis polyprenyl glycosylphosphotransferase